MNQKLKLAISILIATLFTLILTSCNDDPVNNNGEEPDTHTLTLDLNIDNIGPDDELDLSITVLEYTVLSGVNVYDFMNILNANGTFRLYQQHGLRNFVGWALDRDGNNLLDNTLYVEENLTLYAVWYKPNYHDIDFVIHERFASIYTLLNETTNQLQETESILTFINGLLAEKNINLATYNLSDNESLRWSFSRRTPAANTLDDNDDEVLPPPPTVGNTVINANTVMPAHDITVYLWLYTDVSVDSDVEDDPFPYQGRVITMLVVSILIVTLVPTGIIIASKLKND